MSTFFNQEALLKETHQLRDDMMAQLTDDDLAYKLPGDNPSLGELCREMGVIQQIYSRSFTTLKQDWTYQNPDAERATGVEQLKAWYKALDEELFATLRGFTEEDMQNKHVDRGHGFTPSLYIHVHIYREALLIFYAKASVYLKALQKPLNDQWYSWIG